jgi:hypothetical protein
LATEVDLSKFKAFAIAKATTSANLHLTSEESTAAPSEGNASAPASKNSANVLYGIDEVGHAVPVPLSNDRSGAQISRIYNMSKYIILVTDQRYRMVRNGNRCPQIIIEKATGKTNCLVTAVIMELSDFLAADFAMSPLQEDASGTIMTFLGQDFDPDYRGGGYPNLYRLDLSKSPVTVTKIHESTGYVEDFVMNSAGEVLFKFYEQGGGNRKLRIALPDGGFRPAGAGDYANCLTFDPTGDGKTFYITGPTAGADSSIESIAMTGAVASRSTVFDIPGLVSGNTVADYRCAMPVRHSSGVYFLDTVERRTSTGSENIGIAFAKYDPKTSTGKIISVNPTIAVPKRSLVAGDKVIVFGDDKLGNSMAVVFNTVDETSRVLIPPGLFVLSKLSISSDGSKISFGAKRLRDSAFVSGSLNVESPVISRDTDVEMIDVTLPDVHELLAL